MLYFIIAIFLVVTVLLCRLFPQKGKYFNPLLNKYFDEDESPYMNPVSTDDLRKATHADSIARMAGKVTSAGMSMTTSAVENYMNSKSNRGADSDIAQATPNINLTPTPPTPQPTPPTTPTSESQATVDASSVNYSTFLSNVDGSEQGLGDLVGSVMGTSNTSS